MAWEMWTGLICLGYGPTGAIVNIIMNYGIQ